MLLSCHISVRSSFSGGSRTAATSEMEHFVTLVNGFQPATIVAKRSILDAAAIHDPSLNVMSDS